MALNGLLCADVPLRNYSLTQPIYNEPKFRIRKHKFFYDNKRCVRCSQTQGAAAQRHELSSLWHNLGSENNDIRLHAAMHVTADTAMHCKNTGKCLSHSGRTCLTSPAKNSPHSCIKTVAASDWHKRITQR